MKFSFCILIPVLLIGCAAPRCSEVSVSAARRLISVESFGFIGNGTTIEQVIAKLGQPDSSSADGFYNEFNYSLSDGSSVLIAAGDGGKILFVKHTETLFGHPVFDKR